MTEPGPSSYNAPSVFRAFRNRAFIALSRCPQPSGGSGWAVTIPAFNAFSVSAGADCRTCAASSWQSEEGSTATVALHGEAQRRKTIRCESDFMKAAINSGRHPACCSLSCHHHQRRVHAKEVIGLGKIPGTHSFNRAPNFASAAYTVLPFSTSAPGMNAPTPSLPLVHRHRLNSQLALSRQEFNGCAS